jgi:hypothetical protein
MKKFVLLSMLFLLTACFFNEPNQTEIESALKDYFQAKLLHTGDGNLLGQVIGEAMGIDSIQFHSIEKISCTSPDLTSATCEVAYDFTLGKQDNPVAILFAGAGRHKGVESFRFVKSSKGWIVAS